ncbi:MAG: hypothetical protein ACOYXW_18335, partial [Actinomycetota bacterium]
WQQRVEEGITAEDLTDARRIVRDLLQRSELCEPPQPAAEAAPAPTPAPSPAPSPAPALTPTPTPTASLPEGCQEVG